MSTFKTVLITTAVLVLGSALSVAGYVIWSQDQELFYLSARVELLTKQMDGVRNQTDENTARLSRTIKTVNKNFTNFGDREDGLEAVIKLVVKALTSDSGTPTSLQYRNGL